MLLSHTSVFILTFSILNRGSLSRMMPPDASSYENAPALFCIINDFHQVDATKLMQLR